MATHSIISTYFGSITIVLKFPFTSAASTKGRERYNGFGGGGVRGDATTGLGGGGISVGENVADVGVVALLDGRCARVIDRLLLKDLQSSHPGLNAADLGRETHLMVLKNDMAYVLVSLRSPVPNSLLN